MFPLTLQDYSPKTTMTLTNTLTRTVVKRWCHKVCTTCFNKTGNFQRDTTTKTKQDTGEKNIYTDPDKLQPGLGVRFGIFQLELIFGNEAKTSSIKRVKKNKVVGGMCQHPASA